MAVRDATGKISGCEVNEITITGNNITEQEFTDIAKKELATVPVCDDLAKSGYLAKYDTRGGANEIYDEAGGLAEEKAVIDAGALVYLWKEGPLAYFKGAPANIINILDEAAEGAFLPNCAQYEAVSMLMQNNLILQQSFALKQAKDAGCY